MCCEVDKMCWFSHMGLSRTIPVYEAVACREVRSTRVEKGDDK